MLGVLKKVFGTKSDRDIKAIFPLVELIHKEHQALLPLTDDELRGKTDSLKSTIREKLKEAEEEIAALHKQIEEQTDLDISQKEDIFSRIDKLKEDNDKKLGGILNGILPNAFAIIKETARRFKETGQLIVTANLLDHKLASTKGNIEIKGEKAVWKNSWVAAGNHFTWDMLHYDVQLIGGVVLHQGKIAEMATGEGKTLVATLPAFLNALSGKGVHIVTVNNYLAKRDSEWMAPLFEFHGLTVDCIDNHRPNSPERAQAYKCDIIYGTNNEFGFDYLRDNMSREPNDLVQGNHYYAMVDEVDSVLVDDARTPLIISGPVPKGDKHEFYELKPRVLKLVEVQKKLASEFLIASKKLIKGENTKDGGVALLRAYRSFPKSKPLIKYLSEPGIKTILQKTENFYLQDNQREMPKADEPLLFTIDEKNNQIELTEKGIDYITKGNEEESFFVLPDIGLLTNAVDEDESLSDHEKLQKKESIIQDYRVKADRIHTTNQLLKAYCMFEKDTEYVVIDNKVKIVDEQTGRIMEGRRYSDGLHQAIEAKENVKVEDATQTYATITLQNYFRMYHKLAGMTGTAETEAGEFWEIYKLDVVVIPTNKPTQRKDAEDKVFKTIREKFNSVVGDVVDLTQAGRPVLVGTTSVEISELLSKMLNMRRIKHQVLNAKQHAKEADIIAEAGKPGTVTIATNMAGRGTDIKLTLESKTAGGLAIIGTERHESRRVDRQLRGRSGRQGDPGSSQFFVSLEDNLMRLFGSERIAKLMDRMGLEEGEVIQHKMVTGSIARAQKKVEENNFGIRKRLLEYDDVMNSQRDVIYRRRKNALFGERLELDIMNMVYDTSENLVASAKLGNDFDSLRLNTLSVLGIDFKIDEESFKKTPETTLALQLYETTLDNYRNKNKDIAQKALPVLKNVFKEKGATVENILIPFTDGNKQIGVVSNLEKSVNSEGLELIKSMEKVIALTIIDEKWKEHLREMDDLKQSVQNAVYEQKDPLMIYKFEGFEMFNRFIGSVNQETVSFLTKANIPVNDAAQVNEARRSKQTQNYSENKEEARSALAANNKGSHLPAQKRIPIISSKVHGRNDRVTVQYQDGLVKKDVKFKTIESDVQKDLCIILQN